MNAFIQIKNFWKNEVQELIEKDIFNIKNSNNMTIEHYKSLLSELFFFLNENTRIYTVACTKFSSNEMDKVRELLKDILSTMDLDRKVLADLSNVGVEVVDLERPLSSTHALYSSAYYHINYQKPHMIIAHLFILGLLAKMTEEQLFTKFKEIGMQDESMSTFICFCKNQYRPFKLIRTILEGIDLDEKEVASVCHAINSHCKMFEMMILESLERADRKVTGLSSEQMSYN